jgi:hypothetical protein
MHSSLATSSSRDREAARAAARFIATIVSELLDRLLNIAAHHVIPMVPRCAGPEESAFVSTWQKKQIPRFAQNDTFNYSMNLELELLAR